ncbi:HalOD1 output domain-containing protein [Halorussus halophilus]|uniref:HalOD1 output domain-containing protein n=1 Tax=Halorussus halophilus TaxID=2650975 RepID=UPI0013013571|nr:HalOD1 output domain-containing protein [Halorussus halophilus]
MTIDERPAQASLSERVVTTVADAKGVDVAELEPLYHHVDPDALDQLFQTTVGGVERTNGSVTFTLDGVRVTVTSDGECFATLPPESSEDDASE